MVSTEDILNTSEDYLHEINTLIRLSKAVEKLAKGLRKGITDSDALTSVKKNVLYIERQGIIITKKAKKLRVLIESL